MLQQVGEAVKKTKQNYQRDSKNFQGVQINILLHAWRWMKNKLSFSKQRTGIFLHYHQILTQQMLLFNS